MAFRPTSKSTLGTVNYEIDVGDDNFTLFLKRPELDHVTQVVIAAAGSNETSIGMINGASLRPAIEACVAGWDGVEEPDPATPEGEEQRYRPAKYSVDALCQLCADYPNEVLRDVVVALLWAIRGFPKRKDPGARAPNDEAGGESPN